jgi:hypothetical protein
MLRWLIGVFVGLGLWLVALTAGAAPLTCPQLLTGDIASPGTPSDPKEVGRVNQGTPPSACGAVKPFPGVIVGGGNFGYDAYDFKNRSAQTCINVTLTKIADKPGRVEGLSAVAYTAGAAPIFSPTNIGANYVGDTGSPATVGAPQSFSFDVPSLQDFTIVVNETGDGSGGQYTLNVTGCGNIIVSGVTPDYGPTAGGSTVTIRGAGFEPGATVQFGTEAPVATTFIDEMTLTAVTPAYTGGGGPGSHPVDVRVQNPLPTPIFATRTNAFTYWDPITPAFTLTSSVNPSVFGQQVTFSVSISPTVPQPATGTVDFLDGAVVIGSGVLSGGSASFSTAALGVGAHSITASYAGDTFYQAGTSAAISQNVDQSSTTTTLISSSNPSVVNTAVTFTASVAAVAPGAGTPSGSVVFTVDGVAQAPVTLSAGSATFATTFTTVTTHTVVAAYSGDTNFSGSTSATLNQVVNLTGATLALTSSLNPSTFGAQVTLTATVTGNGPTGTVTFSENGSPLSPAVALNAGVATFNIAGLTVGTHAITATYSGDASNSAAAGQISQVVGVAASTTTLTSSKNPSTRGEAVTFTAQVTGAVTGNVTGTVTFRDGTATLGTGTLDSNGRATFSTSTLTVGTHPITAVFGGNAAFGTSTSAAVNQVVNTPTVGDGGTDGGADAGKDAGDSGTTTDSGSGSDSGVKPVVDSGRPNTDGGNPVSTSVEGGGCDCTTAGTTESGALSVTGVLFAVSLMFLRRRKKK